MSTTSSRISPKYSPLHKYPKSYFLPVPSLRHPQAPPHSPAPRLQLGACCQLPQRIRSHPEAHEDVKGRQAPALRAVHCVASVQECVSVLFATFLPGCVLCSFSMQKKMSDDGAACSFCISHLNPQALQGLGACGRELGPHPR